MDKDKKLDIQNEIDILSKQLGNFQISLTHAEEALYKLKDMIDNIETK